MDMCLQNITNDCPGPLLQSNEAEEEEEIPHKLLPRPLLAIKGGGGGGGGLTQIVALAPL